MADFDETDLEILRLLVADGRRPYSDIAETVDLSAPAVRDRIDRLRAAGVINRFTIDVDRSALSGGIPVLIELDVKPGAVDTVGEGLSSLEATEHVYTTADARVIVQAVAPGTDVHSLLANAIDFDDITGVSVSLLRAVEWTPGFHGTSFTLDCAECGNTVTAEGESARIDGSLYHFCCKSCEAQFEQRFAEMRSGV